MNRPHRTERLAIPAKDGVVLDVYRSVDDGVDDDAPAIVVCHGFVQNRLAFESGRRSLLAHLRGLGLVVYVLELRGRAARPTSNGLFEYVDADAAAVVEYAAVRHASVAWLGHSMGGIIGAVLPQRSLAHVDAIVTIGAPLFAGPVAMREALSPHGAIAAARWAHARGFRFEGRRWSGTLYALRKVLDVRALPAPIRIWAPGSLDQATLAYTLKKSFADDSWAVLADLLELGATDADRAGRLDVGARLRRLDRPLLVVAGDADDLAPPVGARPLYERAGSVDKEYLEVGEAMTGVRAGHIDMLIGDVAPAFVWTEVARFLRRHLALPR